jgi:hypothetical protein
MSRRRRRRYHCIMDLAAILWIWPEEKKGGR